MESPSVGPLAVWQCEDVLAWLWASGAFEDAKSIVDMPVLTSVDSLRLALRGAANSTAEEAEQIISQHLAPAGADLHPFNPPDFHPDPPSFLPHVTHAPTRLWALAVHRLWPRLSFRTAPSPTAPAPASHPVSNSGVVRKNDSQAASQQQGQDGEGRRGGWGGAVEGVVLEGGSLLALPHAPVIVPGERFREMYYWDSYWVIRGLLVSGMLDSALSAVRNLLHLARTHGHVPNGSRAYYLNRSQPPLLSHMVHAVHAALDARAGGEEANEAGLSGGALGEQGGGGRESRQQAESLLREALPVLVKEHAFWTQAPHGVAVHHPPSSRTFHLSRYCAMWSRPRPESFPQDTATAAAASQRGTSSEPHVALFRELATVAESGWDFSSRWMRDPGDLTTSAPTSVLPADLNALLFQQETNIAALATALLPTSSSTHSTTASPHQGTGQAAIGAMDLADMASHFAELAEQRREAMEVMMWHEGERTDDGEEGGGEATAGSEGGREGGRVRVGRWRDVWIEARAVDGEEGGAAAHTRQNCEWVAVAAPCDGSPFPSKEGEAQEQSQSHSEQYASDYFPLWCGLLPPGDPRIDLVVASLQSSNLLLPAGVSTSTRFTGQQWDYPNVWPPLHHAICEALLLAASPRALALARTLAHRFLAASRVAFERTGAMHEKYDGRHVGAVGSGGEYNPQVGFGWTNGAVLSLLDLFGYEEP